MAIPRPPAAALFPSSPRPARGTGTTRLCRREPRRPRMSPRQQRTSTRNAPELTTETLCSLPTVPSSVSLPVSMCVMDHTCAAPT